MQQHNVAEKEYKKLNSTFKGFRFYCGVFFFLVFLKSKLAILLVCFKCVLPMWVYIF